MFGAPAFAGQRGTQAAMGATSRTPDGKEVDVMVSLVVSAIERLEETVEQETAALQSRGRFDLKEFNDRKSRGLLDLTRAMRPIEGVAPDQLLVTRLASLRAKLETNSAALKLHLDAVREISAAMADAMRDADSDGTYSRPVYGGNRAL
jgi:hypothetical protein